MRKEDSRRKTKLLDLYDLFNGNYEILIKMISDITGLDINLLKNNVEFNTCKDENFDSGQAGKDFIIEFDDEDNIIVKISKGSFARMLITNVMCILMGVKPTYENNDKDLKLIQIHLNYENNCKKAISKYRIRDAANSYQTTLCIELCPPICSKLYQSDEETSNVIKWGTFFNSYTNQERNEILTNILTGK